MLAYGLITHMPGIIMNTQPREDMASGRLSKAQGLGPAKHAIQCMESVHEHASLMHANAS